MKMKALAYLFLLTPSSIFAMSIMSLWSEFEHWYKKWHNPDYQLKHILSTESKEIARDLEHIISQDAVVEAIDLPTLELLKRASERSHIGILRIAYALERGDDATVERIIKNMPSLLIHPLAHEFIVRSLRCARNRITNRADELDAIPGLKINTNAPQKIQHPNKKKSESPDSKNSQETQPITSIPLSITPPLEVKKVTKPINISPSPSGSIHPILQKLQATSLKAVDGENDNNPPPNSPETINPFLVDHEKTEIPLIPGVADPDLETL